MGRSALVVAPVILKRISYMLDRAVRWNRSGLLYWMILFPLLLFGLLAWALGFRRGCRGEEAPQGPVSEDVR
jgi:hypothetical protein